MFVCEAPGSLVVYSIRLGGRAEAGLSVTIPPCVAQEASR